MNIFQTKVGDLKFDDQIVTKESLSVYVPLSGCDGIGRIGISGGLTVSRKNDGTGLPGGIARGEGATAIGSEFNDNSHRIVKYVSVDDINNGKVTYSSLYEYILSDYGQVSSEVIDVLDVLSGDLVHFSEWGGLIWRKYNNTPDFTFSVQDASVEQLNQMTHIDENYYALYRLSSSGQISSYLYGLPGMTMTRSNGKWCLLRARAIAEGAGSFAQGTGIAYGENSFATGGARAQSYQSFAQGGTNSFAFGRYSHAEGNSMAYGGVSHSEGQPSYAFGYGSHSEGSDTSAFGQNSHAEGRQSESIGYCSHSEGAKSHAIGQYSHAEGFETSSIGTATHASGWKTAAVSVGSYADGYCTSAYGEYSHTEGGNTQTGLSAKYSHAEGDDTVASGYRSHAEGAGSYAIGDGSHAEGFGVSAEGQGSHAAGYYTRAFGAGSYAGGLSSYAGGWYSVASGYQVSAEGYYSRAYGKNTRASGMYSHVDGTNVRLYSNGAYAWSGKDAEYVVSSDARNGTFNIDPIGGAGGFFIENKPLSDVINDYAGMPLKGETFELSGSDMRDMLKKIINKLGGKLTLNGVEII